MTRRIVVLFNRDLRVHDHPALAAASREADEVVPLFVLDDAILRSSFAAPNRIAFLHDSLCDLHASLCALGGGLVVRRGSVVDETVAVARALGADAVFASADVSAYAHRREHALADALDCELRLFPGVTVVEPGALTPTGSDHYKVFTPYWRAWQAAPRRALAPTQRRVLLPDGVCAIGAPSRRSLLRGAGPVSPSLPRGGETAARRLLSAWAGAGVDKYEAGAGSLATDDTSRLSPYLRFGCVSPAEVLDRCPGEAFARQLCWRDFHHQVADAFPAITTADYRPGRRTWRTSEEELAAWKAGRTGVPIVDAGMRQLLAEGWMHNRARLIVASFLTKTLRLDWRVGAAHFWDLLVDGDIPNNAGNWQWVAGTGNDTRPNRVLNPLRQAHRFDPDGDYVRRWIPELRCIPGPDVHRPWRLPDVQSAYPPPLVDLERGAAGSTRTAVTVTSCRSSTRSDRSGRCS